jgi:pimeloyl-ACP methyl ester carboxylesterase
MAPVARKLGAVRGVLEPLQTASSLDGQVQELHDLIERHATPPAMLIGFSWGAMLSFILAARHPSEVGKLLLVGSAPFTEEHAASIWATRMGRLAADERRTADAARDLLGEPGRRGHAALETLDKLLTKADSYDPLTLEAENLKFQPETYARVWAEAEQLRRSGQLLDLGRQIRCPVVAIHGDHDPHPADGVRVPLSAVVEDFRFVLLDRCGHTPWIERHAREPFFRLLEDELAS